MNAALFAAGHAIPIGDGGVAYSHAAHATLGPAGVPGTISGLEWAELVERRDPRSDWLTVNDEPSGFYRDCTAMPIDQLGGGAWDHVGRGDNIADCHAGIPHARFTFYRPGRHDLALTADECDRLIDWAGPSIPADDPTGGPSTITGLPYVGNGKWLIDRLAHATLCANKVWWRYSIPTLEAVQILGYEPGDEMIDHTDWGPWSPNRKLSGIVALSDPADYEGGRLELLYGPKPVRPPMDRGTIVVFPATLLHRLTPVTSGKRHSLTMFWVDTSLTDGP